uniref:DNA polymerase epsilon subunit n=1 Tax=Ascaris suum TaxID=6253 RepID=F1KYE6_ASCSU
MSVDSDRLRKQLKTAFQLRSYSLKRDTLEYAVNILTEFDDAQRSRWIERIIDAISKLSLNSPLLDLETFQSAVANCANKNAAKSESLFNVIDIFSAPRFDYDDSLNKLVLIPGEASAIGNCDDAVNLLRNRLKFVTQRVLRSSAFEHYHLSTVETLLGSASRADNVIVLGLLTQCSADSYQVEDLTGSMPVDLSNATFHSGLFTDGCIMLLEGSYSAGLLTVSGVGLAPIETADATRAFFGNENWFGGESAVAYRTVPRLRSANLKYTDARIVFLSDVWLDDPKVMKGLYNLFVGFSESPPIAFVFCGNFCSCAGTPDAYNRLTDGFRHLANIISEQIDENSQLAESHFVFVPGSDDPTIGTILPRPPLPFALFEQMKKIPNCSFASNPCRIQYANQEIVILRHDIIEKMCRNSIHMPSATRDIAEHFCRTIASVGHLTPLPLHVCPVLWQMDYCLRLYPLPDLVVIADQFQQFALSQHECLFANPGSFARSQLEFHVYYPSAGEIEPSSVNL